MLGCGAWDYYSATYLKKKSNLNASNFTPYTLVEKVPVSSTGSLFTVVPADGGGDDSFLRNLYRKGLWSSEIKQPQLQISRQYTPLGPTEETRGKYGDQALQFFIREEQQGEVSGWIHKLSLGAQIGVRGPDKAITVDHGMGKILFLAGGTGIATAIQLARSLLLETSDKEQLPEMHLLWASRRREECEGGVSDTPRSTAGFTRWTQSAGSTGTEVQRGQKAVLVKELERLKAAYNGRLKVDYFVDEEESFINWDVLKPTLASADKVGEGQPRKRTVLVSGPDGFVGYLAGPKKWQNGQETQGELGGLLQDAGRSGWEVLKV